MPSAEDTVRENFASALAFTPKQNKGSHVYRAFGGFTLTDEWNLLTHEFT